MVVDVLLLVLGLVVLLGGAEWLVRGSSALARRLRISPVVVGLTVVSLGTSAPELAINVIAALDGSTDLAVGNVVGSNVANLLLVLGAAAVVAPLRVGRQTVADDLPLALLSVLLLLALASDRFLDGAPADTLSRTDGFALLALLLVFVRHLVGRARSDRAGDQEEDAPALPLARSAVTAVAGLVALVVGGQLLVDAAVSIAGAAGLSEAFIGLTVVAIGTSLPELATSVVAALRGHAALAVGNAVGSNILNVVWVLGLSSTLLELPVGSGLVVDVAVSAAATALLGVFLLLGRRYELARWQGAAFLGLYAAYTAFLWVRG